MTNSTDPFSASIIPFQAPEQMRALAEKGLSQARDSYAKFKDVAESHNGTIEAVFGSAGKGASEYSAIIDWGDGSPVDLNAVKQNDRLVVHLSGKSGDDAYHQAILVDMLPAGGVLGNDQLIVLLLLILILVLLL